MIKHNQDGLISPLVFPLAFSVVLVLALAGFSVWSSLRYSDLETNFDAMVVQEAEGLRQIIQVEEEAKFTEREKQPFKVYQSSPELASIKISFPKTWSAYVDEDGSSRTELDAYFHPNFIDGLKSDTARALRVTLEDTLYADVVDDYDKAISAGDVTAKTVKFSGVSGVRLDGVIQKDIPKGVMVIYPIRDKTLRVWTESADFIDDFNKLILPNLSFRR